MNAKELLKQKGIDSNKIVLRVDREEALESLMEALIEYCPSVKIEKMTKEDLEILIDSLGENIINYHPEDYHQERGALLSNIKILKKYGLTEEEENMVDFY